MDAALQAAVFALNRMWTQQAAVFALYLALNADLHCSELAAYLALDSDFLGSGLVAYLALFASLRSA